MKRIDVAEVVADGSLVALQNSAVLLTSRDFGVLERLLAFGLDANHPARDILMDKLHEATICSTPPPDLAMLESLVAVRKSATLSAAAETVTEVRLLVLPSRYITNGRKLSVATPFGAGLLGLRPGMGFDYNDPSGKLWRVTLEKVLHQPEVRR